MNWRDIIILYIEEIWILELRLIRNYRGKVAIVCISERTSAVLHHERLFVRYQKKEKGSQNMNPTELERLLDEVMFFIQENEPLLP